MFYTFRQNNSGGVFDYDEERGISVYVIVEADSADDAVDRAEGIGLYFDGGGDCECCGPRWSDFLWDGAGDEEPSLFGEPVDLSEDAKLSGAWNMKWIEDGYETFVHYQDGRIVGAFK